MVGEYLAAGTVVLRVSGGRSDPDPALARRVFVLARQRTVDQDPAFALRMLVDIAIRGALARGQRSHDRGAGPRPDRGAARRPRPAPPGPVAPGRRRRSPARRRPRPPWADYVGSGCRRFANTATPRHRSCAGCMRSTTAVRGGRRGRARPRRARAPPPGRAGSRRSRTPRSARSSSSQTGWGSEARAIRRARQGSARARRRTRCDARARRGCRGPRPGRGRSARRGG